MGDANTPAWLQEAEPEPTPTGPQVVAPPPPPAPAAASGGNSTRGAMTDAEITADDADLPGVILTMRLANMGVSAAMIAISVRFVAFSRKICELPYGMTKFL